MIFEIIFENFKILKNLLGQFIPNHPPNHVTISTNLNRTSKNVEMHPSCIMSVIAKCQGMMKPLPT